MKTKLMSCLFCVGVGLVPSMASSMNEEVQTLIVHQSNKRALSGIVTDATTNEPLIGVSILIKGTQVGTVTDVDGKFILDVSQNDVLEFSYIGYKSQTLAVEGKTILNVLMTPDNEMLDEVVVVGYGSMKKSDLTGAVVSANIKDFEKAPNTNILQSLQGTIPGLNVGQITSAGATPEVSIRGKNTLSGNKNVLIVLDGIIYNSSLASINPNDIESVDVLKDASATAVYGAQAANGVLLITTKRGKSGKTKVDFSTAYTTSSPTKNLRPMNRQEYLDFTREFWYDEADLGPDYKTPNPNFDLASKLPDAVMLDTNSPDGIVPYDTNWWEEGTSNASMWENKLSLSGGTDAMSYLISYANTSQKGFMLNDEFKRNSIRINLDVI